jgi:hypothetical protein
MKQAPVVERTDLEAVTPDRLKNVVDYSLFEEMTSFSHRGSEVALERLISRLGAALDNEAVMEGEESAPSQLQETDAVKVCLDALKAAYPSWFGRPEAVDLLDQDVSEDHLDWHELEERYFQGELNPDTRPVEGDDFSSQKQVIVPLVALVLERVREQQVADRMAEVQGGQERIARTIIEEALERDLDATDIQGALDNAMGRLAESQRSMIGDS